MDPVSLIAIGAGNRLRTYMHYIETHPDKARLVAVVDPDRVRRDSLAERAGVPPERRYADYHTMFADGIKADAVIVATPENLHFEPAMMALDAGYHLLLEKPVAQSYGECVAIADKARAAGMLVSVCHVLRYYPIFVKIKEMIESGEYGKVISIHHTEEVGIDRATHSFVRGSMNREKDSNPMLLAKCCHDLDLLLWMTGAHCRRVSSFGSLRWFRADNAPTDSAGRCIDCAAEPRCPFSAVDLYRTRGEWTRNFIPAPGETIAQVIDRQLREGPFGRCVYRCDNDVVDNQVVTMQMTDGMLVTLSVNFFTQRDCRDTDIKLTGGEISCDGVTLRARDFKSRRTTTYDFSHLAKMKYHGGADMALINDFVDAVRNGGGRLLTGIDDSLEAHRVIFEAEKSRLTGTTVIFGD
ncbi:MAG: Gfo/Idh/MocA family oxidoreductase [Paramuribaculum sp.]|nr:Gfo/Idh/MocA family oxidoreductase [Paramuribaculum sp.]